MFVGMRGCCVTVDKTANFVNDGGCGKCGRYDGIYDSRPT